MRKIEVPIVYVTQPEQTIVKLTEKKTKSADDPIIEKKEEKMSMLI